MELLNVNTVLIQNTVQIDKIVDLQTERVSHHFVLKFHKLSNNKRFENHDFLQQRTQSYLLTYLTIAEQLNAAMPQTELNI